MSGKKMNWVQMLSWIIANSKFVCYERPHLHLVLLKVDILDPKRPIPIFVLRAVVRVVETYTNHTYTRHYGKGQVRYFAVIYPTRRSSRVTISFWWDVAVVSCFNSQTERHTLKQTSSTAALCCDIVEKTLSFSSLSSSYFSSYLEIRSLVL